jgi:hypothetical protein
LITAFVAGGHDLAKEILSQDTEAATEAGSEAIPP